MLVLGILGHPVAHSKSPAMHGAAARALGIDAVYHRFDVLPEFVGDAVRGVRALGLAGVNVTVPHKEAVMPFLDRIDDDARLIGAVNTIVREGTTLVGANTDAPGLVRSLEEASVPLDGAVVTVIGAGGAARAAVVGLARAGAREVNVLARRAEQADTLVRDVQGALSARVVAGDFGALEAAFAGTTLVVQSTSATLHGAADSAGAEAFAASLPLGSLPAHATVIDLVYKPLETTVLRAARERGLRTVDGLGMLLHQGAIAFHRWTGREPPIDVMRAALETQRD